MQNLQRLNSIASLQGKVVKFHVLQCWKPDFNRRCVKSGWVLECCGTLTRAARCVASVVCSCLRIASSTWRCSSPWCCASEAGSAVRLRCAHETPLPPPSCGWPRCCSDMRSGGLLTQAELGSLRSGWLPGWPTAPGSPGSPGSPDSGPVWCPQQWRGNKWPAAAFQAEPLLNGSELALEIAAPIRCLSGSILTALAAAISLDMLSQASGTVACVMRAMPRPSPIAEEAAKHCKRVCRWDDVRQAKVQV